MMRPVLIALASVALGLALWCDWTARQVIWPPTIAAVILLTGVIFENRRYKRVSATAPGPGWEATGERFIDPDSEQPVSVFFNPETGERRYVSTD